MASQTARKSAPKRTDSKTRSKAEKSLPISLTKLPPGVKTASKKQTEIKHTFKKNPAKVPIETKAKSLGKAIASKVKKTRLVRDSFTIPKDEYVALQKLKERAIGLTKPAKKSELLRAGLLALATMSDAAFLATLAAIPALKTGRPKGVKASKK
jgi:hypothetical protein